MVGGQGRGACRGKLGGQGAWSGGWTDAMLAQRARVGGEAVECGLEACVRWREGEHGAGLGARLECCEAAWLVGPAELGRVWGPEARHIDLVGFPQGRRHHANSYLNSSLF
jgi:hypothetical protein